LCPRRDKNKKKGKLSKCKLNSKTKEVWKRRERIEKERGGE
jgi:hypothetical protein